MLNLMAEIIINIIVFWVTVAVIMYPIMMIWWGIIKPKLIKEEKRVKTKPIQFYPDVNDFIKAVIKRNQTHGEEFFASAYSGYGVIAEEFNWELLKAMHENDREQIMNEAMDVAVAAFHLYRTMKYGPGK